MWLIRSEKQSVLKSLRAGVGNPYCYTGGFFSCCLGVTHFILFLFCKYFEMLIVHFESLLWTHRYHFGWNLVKADSSFFLTACDYFSGEQPTNMLTTKIDNSRFIC